jgi:sodium-dependent dicarboxylate transporter 2/3/5
MAAAAMGSSMAFMLPVATPPNAIVFGSGYIEPAEMRRAGFWLNIMGIVIITAAVALGLL